MEKWVIVIICAIIFVAAAVVAFVLWRGSRIRKMVLSGMWISHKEFNASWGGIQPRKGAFAPVGLKFNSMPGCFIIAVYGRSKPDDMSKYESIHIGQSADVYHQVHNIIMGKAKPEIIDSIRHGKSVFLQLLPYDKERMDRTEKQLKAAFSMPHRSKKSTTGSGKKA